MITRDTYELLRYKPPLTPVNKSGVTISGEEFQIEGVAFANIKFKCEDRSEFILEYEPILVSSQISSNLFGMHTDLQFKAANRDHENESNTFIPRSGCEIKINAVFQVESEKNKPLNLRDVIKTDHSSPGRL